MKNRKVDFHIEAIDERIKDLTLALTAVDGYSDEYTDISKNIEKLIDIRTKLTGNRNDERFKGVDVNTLVTGGISLISLFAIMHYEKTDVITTKAMNIATRWIGK